MPKVVKKAKCPIGFFTLKPEHCLFFVSEAAVCTERPRGVRFGVFVGSSTQLRVDVRCVSV